MERIKRHLAVPVLALLTLILVLVYLNIYLAKDRGTFELRDIQGDRSALEDVRIHGEYRDGYHRTFFSIQGQALDTKTQILNKAIPAISMKYATFGAKVINDLHYNVRPSFYGLSNFDVMVEDRTDLRKIKQAGGYVQTGVITHYKNADSDYVEHHFTNDLNYGIAKIGDAVYFTVPTTKDYTGTNGIYEIVEFSSSYGYTNPDRAVEPARELVTFSLDQNKSEHAESLEVLGLEAVGQYLALIMVEGDQLIIRGFNRDGALRGEYIVEDFRLMGNGTASADEDTRITYHPNYRAYVDHDLNVLNIRFSQNVMDPRQAQTTIYSLDFSNGVKLVHTLETEHDLDKQDRFFNVDVLSYRHDKLYILQSFRKLSNELDPHQPFYPKQLILSVYEAGKLLYEGEIVTDLNDDLTQLLKPNPYSHGDGFNETQYRNFDHIRIESAI